jgi:hypothetical protein
MSLVLAVARGTGGLPHQLLEQEMARLGLAVTSACEIRTVNPAKLDANSVGADLIGLDSVSQKTQTLRPAKTLNDVGL